MITQTTVTLYFIFKLFFLACWRYLIIYIYIIDISTQAHARWMAPRSSCRSCAAGADTDHALQGLMKNRRCRGSCRSSPERVHADQALHEHQHEAYVSDLSLRVGGIGRQAFEFWQGPQTVTEKPN